MTTQPLTLWAFPDLDANIGMASNGTQLHIVILAEGCSRKGKPGAFTYTRRNPDRRKAAARLLIPLMALLGSVKNPDAALIAVKAGKGSNGVKPTSDPLAAFRKGGNFRFDCWARHPYRPTDEVAKELGYLAEELGLVSLEKTSRVMATFLMDQHQPTQQEQS